MPIASHPLDEMTSQNTIVYHDLWQFYWIATERGMQDLIEPVPEGTQPGNEIDCGEWESIQHFIDGALPGTYIGRLTQQRGERVEPDSSDNICIVLGADDAQAKEIAKLVD